MRKLLLFSILLLLIHLLSCTKVSENTSDDSELTLLMREMYDESLLIKKQIEAGKQPKLTDYQKRLLSSHSTKAEVAQSEEFKLYAESYLDAYKVLEEGESLDKSTPYESLITTCMNCHRKMCPGPMVKIKKLYLD